MKIDAAAKKSWIIMGAIVAAMAVVILVFVIAMKNATHPAQGGASNPDLSTARDIQKTSESAPTDNYASMAKNADSVAAKQASDNGDSFAPSFAPPARPVAPEQPAQQAAENSRFSLTPGPQQAAGQPTTLQQTPQEVAAAQEKAKAEADYAAKRKDILDAKNERIKEMAAGFVAEGAFSPIKSVGYQISQNSGSGGGSGGGGGAAGSSGSGGGDPFIKAGARAYISIDTAINTDEPSPVLGKVLTGPARGWVIFGKSVHNPDDTVSITFDRLVLPSGKSAPIEAMALDPESGRTSVVGSVNHKIFDRFILPAIAGGAAAYGQLMGQAGMMVMSSPMTGTMTSTNNISSSQITDAAIGAGVGSLANNLNAIAAKEQPSVSTPKNLGLEIVFMKEFVLPN